LAGLNLALMKRWILGPLVTLERTAKDIGDGRFDVHVPVKRDDEFGQVCRAFNQA
jgi:nitrate/nitrite-specific signal transduction histidine kinase